jgi:hypothetical protein
VKRTALALAATVAASAALVGVAQADELQAVRALLGLTEAGRTVARAEPALGAARQIAGALSSGRTSAPRVSPPAATVAAAPANMAAAPANAAVPQSGQSAASAAAKGRIAPLSVQVIGALSQPEVKAFTAKASAVIDLALATPALYQPRGFSITRSLTIDTPPSEQPQSNPFLGRATMIVQMIDLEHGATPDAQGAYMGRLEGPSMHIRFNNLTALYANNDGGGMNEARYLPLKMTVRDGFPVFRVGIREVILITKPGRLPYVPMTKGERLRQLSKEIDDPKVGEALASMSPQELAQPACSSSRLSEFFGDCSKDDATSYVRLNPDYFDKDARKGAIQLVAISTPIPGGHGHKILEPRLKAAADAIDLRAIQALLD